MFRGIFGDESFIDEFFDTVGDLFEGFNEAKERVEKRVKELKETYGDEKQNGHSHSYTEEKTYVDDELVDSKREERKDGKVVKSEHYCKDEVEGRNEGTKRVCGCGSKDCNNDVEYTIEFDEPEAEEPNPNRVDALRKCVNQLCKDAETDHKKIANLNSRISDLEVENASLRSEIEDTNNNWKRRESQLLEHIERLESEIHAPSKASNC